MSCSPLSRRFLVAAGLAALSSCSTPDQLASVSSVGWVPATEVAQTCQAREAYPRTTFGRAVEIELTDPPVSTRVIVQYGAFELGLDGDHLADSVSAGSDYPSVREVLRRRARSSEPVRLSVELVPMSFIADSLRSGEAALLCRDTGLQYDRIVIVPWSTQPAPNAHSSGGEEFRLADGEVLFRISTWIE